MNKDSQKKLKNISVSKKVIHLGNNLIAPNFCFSIHITL